MPTFVTSLVHSCKGQVAVLSNEAARIRRIRLNISVSRFLEARICGRVRLDGQTDCLASEPVALIVSISVYKRDLDTFSEQGA
jgi:hypothetical protein